MAFEVGDFVYLRVSPSKGIVQFGKQGKLNPRFIGPFEILERVGLVAYRLALSNELEFVHNVFHVSMLRKCISDKSKIILPEPLQIQEDLTYVEQPVEILDRKDQVLRTKTISMVKVLWRSHTVEEATWESEEEMKKEYPYLFDL